MLCTIVNQNQIRMHRQFCEDTFREQHWEYLPDNADEKSDTDTGSYMGDSEYTIQFEAFSRIS